MSDPHVPETDEYADEEAETAEADEAERSESDWGLAPKKAGMARETKFGLFVVLLLMGGFGYVVYQKIQDKKTAGDEVATSEEPSPESAIGTGDAAPASGGEADPFTALDNNEPDFAQSEPGAAPTGTTAATGAAPADSFAEPVNPADDANAVVSFDPEPDAGAAGQAEPADAHEDPFASTASGGDAGGNPFGGATAVATTGATQDMPQDAVFDPNAEDPLGEYQPGEAGEAIAQAPAAQPEVAEEFIPLPMDAAVEQADEEFRPEDPSDTQLGEFEPVPVGSEQAESSTFVQQPSTISSAEELAGTAAPASFDGQASFVDDSITAQPSAAPMQVPAPMPVSTEPLAPASAPVPAPAAIDVGQFEANSAAPPPEPADPFEPAGSTPAAARPMPVTTEALPMHRPAGRPADVGHHNDSNHAGTGGQTYVVQPHDNFWKISKKVYGTGRYYMALAKVNQQRIPDPLKMRPGVQIVTPARDHLDRMHSALIPRGDVQVTNYRGEASPSASLPGFFLSKAGEPMYCVGPEDTLTTIAHRTLGKASRWDEVYRLNKSTLANPDALRVGSILRLPTDASGHRISGKSGSIPIR